MRCKDLLVFQKRGSLIVISDTHRPAPRRLHSIRKGLSVTPAMGASTRFGSIVWGPMRMRRMLAARSAMRLEHTKAQSWLITQTTPPRKISRKAQPRRLTRSPGWIVLL